jgi:hypothetical protein
MDNRLDDDQEEEEYIDLDDISIYENDPEYEPSEEEIIYYAERLGFDVENDPKEFLSIAEQALKAQLPENWRRAVLRSKNELVYINLDDNTIHLYTEIDEMAYKYYCEEKEKWLKSKAKHETRTKVVPRGKIPPLKKDEGESKDGNRKKTKKKTLDFEKDADSIIENIKHVQNKNKEKENNLDEGKNKYEDPSSNLVKSKTVNNKGNNIVPAKNDNLVSYGGLNIGKSSSNSNYDPYNIPTKYDKSVNDNKFNLNLNHNDNIKSSEDKKKEYNNGANQNEENNYIKHDSDEEEDSIEEDIIEIDDVGGPIVENIEKSDKNDMNNKNALPQFINIADKKNNNNLINNIDINNLTTHIKSMESKQDKQDASALKKDFYIKKQNELNDYETVLKENYIKAKEEYQDKKNNYKSSLIEEYDMKAILNKRKAKADFEIELQKELEDQENELEIKYQDKYREYKKRIEKEISDDHTSSTENVYESKIKELEKLKDKLQEEIELTNIEKLNSNLLDSELLSAKNILEEKFAIDKRNLERRYELLEKEIELEEESKYNKDIELIQKQANYNFELQDKAIKSSHNKLLDDYKKTLDQDYNMQVKTILIEFEEKSKRELTAYKNSIEKEKEDKVILYRKEMNDMEKEYFNDLNLQRDENRKQTIQNDKRINTKFENILNVCFFNYLLLLRLTKF